MILCCDNIAACEGLFELVLQLDLVHGNPSISLQPVSALAEQSSGRISQRLLMEVRMIQTIQRRRTIARIERQHLGQQIVGILAQLRAQVARQSLLPMRKSVPRYRQATGPLGGRRTSGQADIAYGING